jgi:hypothetical protein
MERCRQYSGGWVKKRKQATNSLFFVESMKTWQAFEIVYLKTVAVFLLLTGMAKLISTIQKVAALGLSDPLIRFLSFKQISIVAGIVEIAVALYIFKSSNVIRRLEMVAWLSLLFIAYHVGLYLIQFHGVCPCLGNANSWLKLSDNSINNITLGLLAYFSIAILMLGVRWRFHAQKQNQERV